MVSDLVGQVLSSGGIGNISKEIGADEGTTQSAISAALPLLIGALSRNASSSQGADALSSALRRDHDGSVLDDFGSLMESAGSGTGDGILRHVLGNRRNPVESALSKSTGLDIGSAGQLLTLLAPLVMGALGKVQQQKSLDSDGLSSLLRGEAKAAPSEAGSLLSLLDFDGDGDVMDDVSKLGTSLLGGLFKK